MSKFPSNWLLVFVVLFIVIFFATIYFLRDFGFDAYASMLFIMSGLSTIVTGRIFIKRVRGFIYSVYLWVTEDGERIQVIHLDIDTPIPEQISNMAQEIEDLGFTKLGVKATLENGNEINRSWIWLDNTRTTAVSLVEAVSRKPFVVFSITHQDEFVIETAYNFPINKQDGAYIMLHNLNSSISETYAFHLHIYNEQIDKHGQAKIFNTLEDTDSDANKRKQILKQLHFSSIRSWYPALLSYGTVTLAFLLATVLAFINFEQSLLAFFIALVLIVIYTKLYSADTQESVERKSRKAKAQ